MANIEKIITYPIKSIAGVETPNTLVKGSGLLNDRTFALVKNEENNPSKKWLSQRELPELSSFEIRFNPIDQNELLITHLDYEYNTAKLQLRLLESRNIINLNICDDIVIASESDQEVGNFFSDVLGEKLRLLRYDSREISRLRYKVFQESPTLQDGVPLSIVNLASLRKLNEVIVNKGGVEIPIENFRANIILDNCGEPFDEKNCNRILIKNDQQDSFDIKIIESIHRCIMTQVDILTGQKTKNPVLA
jgi:uncharacterized protein